MVGFTGTDKNGHPDGLISVKSKLYFVFSQRKIKPLRVPVEVIHDTGVPLVHINLNFLTGFFRIYFDPNGSVIGIPVWAVTTITITMPVTTITITMPVTMSVTMSVTITMPVVVLRIGVGRK